MPQILAQIRDMFGFALAMPATDTVRAGLAGFTLVPALILWRTLRAPPPGPSPRLTLALCMIAAMTATNAVVPHLMLGTVLGGYVPGLITAVAFTLPIGVLTLAAARREAWLTPGLWLAAIAAGIILLPFVLLGFWALGELVAEIGS